MPRQHISSGSPFEAQIGYSRAVVEGGWIFVAGTTGYDYATMTMPESVVDQCRNTLKTIEKALQEAGASLDDVTRARYILPDPADFEPCWPVLSEAFATRAARGDDDRRGVDEPGDEDRDRGHGAGARRLTGPRCARLSAAGLEPVAPRRGPCHRRAPRLSRAGSA